MKFLDVFNPIIKGNFALTDEAVYSSILNNCEMIPLWGGNKEHNTVTKKVSETAKTKENVQITVFNSEGIIISLDGSAGNMTYKNGEKFALNHHAGFITLKEDALDKVNLRFFAIFFQNFYRALSVSDGSKTLSLQQIYSEEFNLPLLKIQNKIMAEYDAINNKIILLNKFKKEITALLEKEINCSYKNYQAKREPVKNVIDYMSGNSGLTEEFIYTTLQNKNEKYKILSGTIEDNSALGMIPMCKLKGSDLKVFKKREGLLVIRKGKAGQTKFLKCGNYSINDNAYILYKKEKCPYKVDLRWLSIQYRPDFLSFASNSDNGTWNMTGFFNSIKIDIPNMEEQLKIVSLYDAANEYLNKIIQIQEEFDYLLSKEIVAVS